MPAYNFGAVSVAIAPVAARLPAVTEVRERMAAATWKESPPGNRLFAADPSCRCDRALDRAALRAWKRGALFFFLL